LSAVLPGARLAAGIACAWAALMPIAGVERAGATDRPEVRVGAQVYVGNGGISHPQVATFRGIPYAAPPVGELRWQAPQALREPAGRRDAARFAAGCYQDSYNTDWYRKVGAAFGADPADFRDPPFSEDCLYLNVWTPRLDAAARLPVMVWIHGGANRSGWSFEPDYLGESLAARGDVVVVSIAYRVGIFGFFGHPELRGATNFGLLDQIAALRWVRDHIAAFGGDAENVTVFGESAGAADIGYLMVSPPARGLFRRAISESGGYQLLERRELAEVESWGRRLSAAVPGQPGLAGLRRLDSAALLAAASRALKDVDYGPAVDGASVRKPTAESFRSRSVPLDLLVGTNQDEWYMYVDDDPATLAADVETYPAPARPALRDLAAFEPTVRRGHDRAVTFANMVCPGYLMAGAVRRSGSRAWVYRFTRIRDGAGGERLRAYHGAEIPYVFDTHDAWLTTDPADRQLTGAMQRYWANFARGGDPNGAGLPEWPAYAQSDARVMELGNHVGELAAPDHALCLQQADVLYAMNGARP
jgi:para-nitrobenzyl esterase